MNNYIEIINYFVTYNYIYISCYCFVYATHIFILMYLMHVILYSKKFEETNTYVTLDSIVNIFDYLKVSLLISLT